MVHIDDHLRPNDVGPELVASKHYRQHFLLSSGVVQLCIIKIPACIIDSPKDLVPSLAQNRSNCIISSIAHYLKRFIPIGHDHDWCRSQPLIDHIKGLQARFIKIENGILLKQITQRLDDFRNFLDEPSVETGMA